MVILDDYCTIVDRDTDATVVQIAAINGMYVIYLNRLIHLQELKLEQNLKNNCSIEEENELKLLHERTGHVNCSTLIDAYRCRHIVFRGADFDIHGFCDLGWAEDIDTKRVYNWVFDVHCRWTYCLAIPSTD
jgi:hypothetical protein